MARDDERTCKDTLMTSPIKVSTTAVVAGLVASSLALSACQKPAPAAPVPDPNAAASLPATAPAAPYPAAAPAPAPTVRYIERPSRREHEDEQAYAARLASDAAYQARQQQAALDRARYGRQPGYGYGPPPPPPGDPYRAGLRTGETQGYDQGRDQQARLDAYQSQAARQGLGQARVDEARRQLADAYREAAETPDPNRRGQIIAAAKDRLAAAMAEARR
jgi:hypothetical protein